MTELTFDQWLADLDDIANEDGITNYTAQTGRECWWSFYEAGVTPVEARTRYSEASPLSDGGEAHE